jgi:hypothetical protein
MRLGKRYGTLLSAVFGLAAFLLLFLSTGCGTENPTGLEPGAKTAGNAAPETGDAHAENEAAHAEGEAGHACSGNHADGEPHAPCTGCQNQKSTANWLIDIGEHAFLGRIDLFSDEGKVVLTIYDHEKREPYPHEFHETKLNLRLEGGSKQLVLEPQRGVEDLIGETCQYRVTDPALKGLEMLEGRLNITLDGKTYVCDLKAAH